MEKGELLKRAKEMGLKIHHKTSVKNIEKAILEAQAGAPKEEGQDSSPEAPEAGQKKKENTYPNPILKGEATVKVFSKVHYNFLGQHLVLEKDKTTIVSKKRWELSLKKIPCLERLIKTGVIKVD